ncbi:MAG: GNAT family N-acetyltransferase [Pseudomonadota bacterium]
MRLVQGNFSQEEWTALVTRFQDLSLMQTWEYGEAKAQTGPWKVARLVWLEEDNPVGACQAMVRTLPVLRGGLVWVNRGPLWRRRGEAGGTKLLFQMLAELKRFWVDEGRMYLRLALPIELDEGSGNFPLPPGYAWVPEARGWASARLNLSNPIDLLFQKLHQKWRNSLSKARRLDLSVEYGATDQIFHQIINEYENHLTANPYATSISPDFLRILQRLLPQERKLWGVWGMHQGRPLGGILITRYGYLCEYIVGAVNTAGRAVNAGNFMLWQAMSEMKRLGYHWLDLGGFDPVKTPPGIYHFKSGLGGTPYRLVGELEAGRGVVSRALRWYIRRRHLGTDG